MRTTSTLIAVAAALSLCLALPSSTAAGAPMPQGREARLSDLHEEADLAWDRGDYVEALEGYLEILRSPAGKDHLREIALTTGELYVTREVAPDGRNVRISPDGRWASYETRDDGATTTRLARLGDEVPEVLSVEGEGLVFAPGGDLAALLTVADSAELEAAQARLDEPADSEDREAIQEARRELVAARIAATRVSLVDLAEGEVTAVGHPGLNEAELVFAPDGKILYVVAGELEQDDVSDVWAIDVGADASGAGASFERVTDGPGHKSDPLPVAGGELLVYTVPERSPLPSPDRSGFRRFGGGDGGPGKLVVLELSSGETRELAGDDPTVSADGSLLAWSVPGKDVTRIEVLDLGAAMDAEPRTVLSSDEPTGQFAVSPSGHRLVVQRMPREDWELYLVETRPHQAGAGGSGDADAPGTDADTDAESGAADSDGDDPQDLPAPVRLTREIQHDLAARFLTDDTLLAAMGEGRHRRSHLYDADTLERTRLFHNNTVRTIAPEYEWTASADGEAVLIVSERDGDTVSPERAVYLVDLTEKVTPDDVIARLEESLAAEHDLRARGERMYRPIVEQVREVVDDVDISRLYRYQHELFRFGSKYITEPGNEKAMEYLRETYASFGYEPELQWFETPVRGREQTFRSANVLARLEGTENPELIYVVSSHFDSTFRGPGADDNTSGTAMLLETARVLADRPLPATVVFASFTGEEAGLLGSREFVRQAVEEELQIVGALNNDMMGWSNDHRLDNTIRYSNAGIRDVQHAAAFLFSGLITYDALYYKSTDAAAYYEAYGDIVGGIGSYPVLGNPHYHRSHDVLETMNHEQITETTRANVASIILLASSPSRIEGLEVVEREGDAVTVVWEPSPESDVVEYRVRYGPADGPFQELRVTEARATLPALAAGARVSVKAIDSDDLEGWDWAWLTVHR